METLKVSAKSVTTSVAGAIAGVIRENGEVEIQAVGAGDSSGQDATPMPGSTRYIARAGRLPDPRSTGPTQCADNRFPAVVRRPGRRR